MARSDLAITGHICEPRHAPVSRRPCLLAGFTCIAASARADTGMGVARGATPRVRARTSLVMTSVIISPIRREMFEIVGTPIAVVQCSSRNEMYEVRFGLLWTKKVLSTPLISSRNVYKPAQQMYRRLLQWSPSCMVIGDY